MKSFSFSVKSVGWVKNKKKKKKKKKKKQKKKNSEEKKLYKLTAASSWSEEESNPRVCHLCFARNANDRLYGAPTILCLIYQVFVKFEKNVPLPVIYFILTVTGSSPQAISKAPSTVSVFILKIKCSLNLLVSYVCFNICGGIERALSRGHPARMQFPQTLCPLCDKQVIRKCNSGFISFIFSKFSQNCLSHAKQLFLYKYGFRPHVSDENDHWKWNFCKMLSRKTLFSHVRVDGRKQNFSKMLRGYT